MRPRNVLVWCVASICLLVGCGEGEAPTDGGADACATCARDGGGGDGGGSQRDGGSPDGGGSGDDGGPPGDSGSQDAGTGMRVFVTGARGLGALGGLDGADRLCNSSAATAGLEGTYAAWLSVRDGTGSATNAIDRITADGPWYRTDGALAFADRAQLATAPSIRLDLDENGARPDGTVLVWTGTSEGGGAADQSCLQWTSSEVGDQAVVGDPLSTTGSWTDSRLLSCAAGAHVYCFQVGPTP